MPDLTASIAAALAGVLEKSSVLAARRNDTFGFSLMVDDLVFRARNLKGFVC